MLKRRAIISLLFIGIFCITSCSSSHNLNKAQTIQNTTLPIATPEKTAAPIVAWADYINGINTYDDTQRIIDEEDNRLTVKVFTEFKTIDEFNNSWSAYNSSVGKQDIIKFVNDAMEFYENSFNITYEGIGIVDGEEHLLFEVSSDQ